MSDVESIKASLGANADELDGVVATLNAAKQKVEEVQSSTANIVSGSNNQAFTELPNITAQTAVMVDDAIRQAQSVAEAHRSAQGAL